MIYLSVIPFILIAFAAFFKAVADTCADHFYVSVFKYKNRSFWDKATGSTKAKRIFGYKVDAWHLSNSAMIICFIGAGCFGLGWMQFIVAGFVFNIVFNLFYNKILR
jgi:hypothetical protein